MTIQEKPPARSTRSRRSANVDQGEPPEWPPFNFDEPPRDAKPAKKPARPTAANSKATLEAERLAAENRDVIRSIAVPDDPSAVTQINGGMRFDWELECWLNQDQRHIRLNLLTGIPELHRPSSIEPLTDQRINEIRFSFKHAGNGKAPSKVNVFDAVDLIAERNAYHPVHEYLAPLQWDGVRRIDDWLARYAGAENTPLNRAFARKILCAAVRRVREPGCKFDSMLVLQGAQDLGKSSLIKALCRDASWFTDQLKIGAPAKETLEQAAGAWIVEAPELDGLSGRDVTRVKSFITTTHDKARLSYARQSVNRGRGFVLFGTTNEADFLVDTTGNRRWWIVRVSQIDLAGLRSVRDQLWAEAVAAEPVENLHLDTIELKAAAGAVTAEAFDGGPWAEALAEKIPDGDMKIAASDVWKIVGINGHDDINRLTKMHQAHMRAAMTSLGFERNRNSPRRDGKKTSAWTRGDATKAAWWSPGDAAPRAHDLGVW